MNSQLSTETIQGVDTKLTAARVRLTLAETAYNEAHNPQTLAELLDAKADFDKWSRVPVVSMAVQS